MIALSDTGNRFLSMAMSHSWTLLQSSHTPLIMQVEDLSCMETTVFDRVFDNECTTDVEAESQLLMSYTSYQDTSVTGDEITSLIR